MTGSVDSGVESLPLSRARSDVSQLGKVRAAGRKLFQSPRVVLALLILLFGPLLSYALVILYLFP